jgi:hypothetical protein
LCFQWIYIKMRRVGEDGDDIILSVDQCEVFSLNSPVSTADWRDDKKQCIGKDEEMAMV